MQRSWFNAATRVRPPHSSSSWTLQKRLTLSIGRVWTQSSRPVASPGYGVAGCSSCWQARARRSWSMGSLAHGYVAAEDFSRETHCLLTCSCSWLMFFRDWSKQMTIWRLLSSIAICRRHDHPDTRWPWRCDWTVTSLSPVLYSLMTDSA